MRIEARKDWHSTYLLENKLNNAIKNKDWKELDRLTDRELNPLIIQYTLFVNLDFWTEYDDLHKNLTFLRDRWWIQCKVREELPEKEDMGEDIDEIEDDIPEDLCGGDYTECGEGGNIDDDDDLDIDEDREPDREPNNVEYEPSADFCWTHKSEHGESEWEENCHRA